MRRLFLGLLLASLLLPTLGGCSTGCDLEPPAGDPITFRTRLVGFTGQTMRVIELPPEVSLGREQNSEDIGLTGEEGSPSATTILGLDGSVITEPPATTIDPDTPELFDPASVNPDEIFEIALIGSADELVIGEQYEIVAYSGVDGVVAVLNNGCRGADTVKNIDGSNVGGWGLGSSSALVFGLLIFVPTAGAIAVLYVLRFLAGRRKGPSIKPGRL